MNYQSNRKYLEIVVVTITSEGNLDYPVLQNCVKFKANVAVADGNGHCKEPTDINREDFAVEIWGTLWRKMVFEQRN